MNKMNLSICYFTMILAVGCTHQIKRDPDAVFCNSSTRQKITGFTAPTNGLVKVAFFDADSTLRVAPSGNISANSIDDVMILPNVGRALAQLKNDGFLVYIVSNQNGVGSGAITCDVADGALKTTISKIAGAGGFVHGYDFAENKDEYRKPDVGMAKRLEEVLKGQFGAETKIDRINSFMVGDSAFKKFEPGVYPGDLRWSVVDLKIVPAKHFSNADRLFAQNYGIYFYEATDFFGWRKYGVDVLENKDDVKKLLEVCTDCKP